MNGLPKPELVVIAEIVVAPADAEAIAAVARDTAAHARDHEAGCLQYDVFEDRERPGHLWTFERWTDDAALDAHIAYSADVPGAETAFAMLTEPLKITRLLRVG